MKKLTEIIVFLLVSPLVFVGSSDDGIIRGEEVHPNAVYLDGNEVPGWEGAWGLDDGAYDIMLSATRLVNWSCGFDSYNNIDCSSAKVSSQ